MKKNIYLVLALLLSLSLIGCNTKSSTPVSQTQGNADIQSADKDNVPVQSKADVQLTAAVDYSSVVDAYLSQKKLEIAMNSGAVLDIKLPSDFTAVKDGVNVGELLKQRNELSKKNNLDFSKYMGKTVKMFTASIDTGDPKSNYDVVLLIAQNKVVGYWVDAGMKDPKQKLRDFNVLVNLQTDPQVETFLEQKNLNTVKNSELVLDIGLPSDFKAVKKGVNVGELLKQRNELSKKNNLDFSKYMGQKVKMYAYTINTGDLKSNYDVVLFVAENEIVGYWVDAGMKDPKQKLRDYYVLANLKIG